MICPFIWPFRFSSGFRQVATLCLGAGSQCYIPMLYACCEELPNHAKETDGNFIYFHLDKIGTKTTKKIPAYFFKNVGIPEPNSLWLILYGRFYASLFTTHNKIQLLTVLNNSRERGKLRAIGKGEKMHFLMRFEKKWKVNEAGRYREGDSEGGGK